MRKIVWSVAVLAACFAGCSGSTSEPGVASDAVVTADSTPDAASSGPPATTAPTSEPVPVPTPTVAPTATSEPVPVPTPTVAPTATAVPEPLTLLTLADAQAGTLGANWAVALGGEETPFLGFVEPDGEAFPDPEGVLSFVANALLVSGTPDDEWVEIDISWAGNGSTAWIRTADYSFFQTSGVFEVVRSTGELRLWEAGEVIWSATNLAPQERSEQFMPVGVGGVIAVFQAERFAGRTGPEYHPEIIGLSLVLTGLDTPQIAPLGIRGFTDGEYLPGDGESRGLQIWVSSDELDALLDLMPVGTRVEIVP